MHNTNDNTTHSLATVVQRLEEEIVLGFLHPKERLVEDELMSRFNVKRHLIRTALDELVQLGVVERRKNIGAVVRSYDYAEVADLYEMRDLLEAEAARRMECPAKPEKIALLKSIQDEHDKAVIAGDLQLIFRANMAFHTALFSLCPNKELIKTIRYFFTQTHAIRSFSARSAESQARSRIEHHAIIKALELGEKEDLIRLCREHISPARDEYLSANKHYLR